MDSRLEKVENNVATLEISVSAERLEEGIMKSYLKNVKKFNIAGFRKGKAPRRIIERHYGEAVFYEDAINIICPDAYDEAVKEHNLEPVDRPDIDIVEIESGKGLVFKAVVTVKPEVTLGQYKGIEAEKKEYNVTDEEVDKEIDIMREKNARLVEVSDRAVKNGDITIIDFKGFADDIQFEGGTSENYSLEIGSGQFIPGFEEQLVGAELGKEVDVNVQFPKEYNNEELAGKPALFKVTVKEIKEKQLVELDDEFAKDVSEFATLDELKEEIKKVLVNDSERAATRNLENDLVKQVVAASEVEVPEKLVERQIDHRVRDLSMRLNQQGFTLEAYLEMEKISGDELRERFREGAQEDVRTGLILEAVGKAEELTVSEEEYEQRLQEVFGATVEDFSKLKSRLEYDGTAWRFKDQIIGEKILQLLVDSAEVTTEYKDSLGSENVDKADDGE